MDGLHYAIDGWVKKSFDVKFDRSADVDGVHGETKMIELVPWYIQKDA